MDRDPLYQEVLFLVGKFLEGTPCQRTFKTFVDELNEKDVLPKRVDWTGEFHSQTFKQMERAYPHVKQDHLLEICKKLANVTAQERKGLVYVPTLLGIGNHSVIRSQETERKYFNVRQCAVRKHNVPLLEPTTFRKHNFVKVLYGREISGPFNRKHFLSGCQYRNMQLLGRTLGHLSAVYCILFTSSGQYIVTGADDLLVKVWHAVNGRLLCTLRGASAEITDLAINNEGTLLAAGSVDKVVRIWCLQTAYPVATLTIHTGLITSVNFCPSVVNGCRYFASTATDGSVAFWKYATDENGTTSFESTPVQYLERMRPGCAQILCGAFSAGGMFLATGSADHNVRVYKMAGLEGPTRVLEVEMHSDRVDSILWAHSHLKFVSGSKDGTAIIWYFQEQRWKCKILCMSAKLPGLKNNNDEGKQKIRVTMLSWDQSDQWVITASSDNVIRVWDTSNGNLVQVLQGHRAETYVIESHPIDSKILLSAGHDGKIFLWNIVTGDMLASFQNSIDGHGFGAVFDAKWSPDGSMFGATDSHGQILTFGMGLPDVTRKVPRELFFHTDYRPLTRDASGMVLDEQTQTPPHLMAPPFLVDVDGNPYPPYLQRLVPGREHCDTDQLVPNVVLNDEGNGLRFFAGDVEGVRQSSGNWQRGDNIPWANRLICKPLEKYAAVALADRVRSLAHLELDEYRREMKKVPDLSLAKVETDQSEKFRKGRVHNHSYRTRASRTEQLQMEFENAEISSESDDDDSTARESELDSSSTTSTNKSASSDYSDWTADNGMNKLEPPKRTARVRNVKKAKKIASTTQKKPSVPQDIPEEYRPPDWLSEVCPKKSPYYPQMGDEVMFFQQGYNLYLNAVQSKNIYKVRPAQLNPWRKIKLKEPQLVKVIGIKYEIRPPRLCGLRLAVMSENNHVTPHNFDLKYHDISDVIDFLVLRQLYDTAVARNWKVGDRFRSVIDDAWWFGSIVTVNRNAQSPFLCYRIHWDNNEDENLSPWDLEPLNSRKPHNGSSMSILPREMKSILYKPDPEEWPGGGIEETCKRILRGLEDLMTMSIAEHFLVPVDFSMYPSYAYFVEYPIDLSTIKARLENRFYRRLTAVQFDARYIASNAEKFNERGSSIVKHARVITETLLKIIKAAIPLDVTALVHQLQENYLSVDSADEEKDVPCEPGPSTSKLRLRSGCRHSARPLRRCNVKELDPDFDWRRECKELLHLLWINEDSGPFRHPVDRLEHPDYDKIVIMPMDLTSIREELQIGNYHDPVELCKDIRLIFQNAKNYTPNKKSRIYAMTVRLSVLAETHMRRIIYNWKRSLKMREHSDTEVVTRLRRSSKRKRDMKDNSTEECNSSIDEEDIRRRRLKTTTTSTTTTTTTTTLGDESLRETRSSGRLRRKLKKIVLSENMVGAGGSGGGGVTSAKKSSDHSTDSEWEKQRYIKDIPKGRKRNLRERKLWNYAKMLEDSSDEFSESDDDDDDNETSTATNGNAITNNNSGAAVNSRNKSAGSSCGSSRIRRDANYDVDAAGPSNYAIVSMNNDRESRPRRPPSTPNPPPVRNVRSRVVRRRNDCCVTPDGDLRRSRLRRRHQICHYVEHSDSSDDYDDYGRNNKEEDEDVDISVSVSRSGRIRRLTAKARAHIYHDI